MPATEQDDILLTYFQRLPKVELHLHLEGAIPLLWHRASGGSWGGQRLSMADYVAGAGARGRGERRRRVFMSPPTHQPDPACRSSRGAGRLPLASALGAQRFGARPRKAGCRAMV